jgi:hypothetical protein
MDKDLLDILSNSNKDIDNQKLMDYLGGKLQGEEKHEVEKWMAENEFVNEAMEGLQDFSGKKNLQEYVDQLHKDLNKYIQQKKERRERRKIQQAPWVYLTIVVVLALCVIAYYIIRKLLH